MDDEKTIKVTLIKPVKGGDGNVITELQFDEPTGSIIMSLGFPHRYETNTDGVSCRFVDTRTVSKYIEALTHCSTQTLHSLSGPDFAKCNLVVMNFFSEEVEKSAS